MTKDEIRQQIRRQRDAVTDEQRSQAGRQVARALLDDEKLRLLLTCWRFSVYLSRRDELTTRHIIRSLFAAGREVCVPVWTPELGRYDLCAMLPNMPMVNGPMGIREPLQRIPMLIWDVDVFIMPGLAFDRQGGRLGYGGGYFDRILAKARPQALKMAIGYDFQVLDTPLPQEPHDCPVDLIVTEKRLIDCRKNRPNSTPPTPATP